MPMWLAAAALAGCAPPAQHARPALWEVTGPQGQKGWLFGTIHALARPADWRSPVIDRAFAQADTLVVEVRDLEDAAAMADTFARLSRTPGLPPLSQRVEPGQRSALARLLAHAKLRERDFFGIETWAAAVMLARLSGPEQNTAYGIDRAVIRQAGKRQVIELEGTAGQLAIFDRLAEKEQRDLLALVVSEGGAARGEDERLAKAWRTGDFAVIEAETRSGLLADPELRAALFTQRNRDWARRLSAIMAAGARPFMAVGAAHMASSDGVPAMLEQHGLVVTRIQ